MNVQLTPELEQLVNDKIESGHYKSPDEVVREALRLLDQKDEARLAQIQELRNRIEQSVCELDRGEGIEGAPFMQGLIEGLEARPNVRLDDQLHSLSIGSGRPYCDCRLLLK